MRKITKRSAAIITAATLAVGGLGAGAWAAGWFEGAGEVVAATDAAQAVRATVTPKTNLFPGAVATATVKGYNPNNYPVKVTGITGSQTGGNGFSGPNAACTFANSKITFNQYREFVIPAKADGVDVEVTDLVIMGKDADKNCAGGNIRIPLTFAGEVN
jgi:hypothetical protein